MHAALEPPTAADATGAPTVARAACRAVTWSLILAVSALLSVLTFARMARGVGALLQRDEVMYGEAIIYGQANRLLHAQPLYQPLNQLPYTVAAYTPLYYAVVAALQWIFGPGFGPGRAVSLAAALVCAAAIAYMAARRAGSVFAGLFATGLFFALGFPGADPNYDYPWFALYKEDMLGVALSIAAIATLDGGTSRRRVVVSALLASLAVLTKQTLGAAGAAIFVWLLVRNLRFAAVFAAISFGILLATSTYWELTTHAFLANILAFRSDPLNGYVFRFNLETLLQYQAAPLAITGVFVLVRLWRRELFNDVLGLYAIASVVPLIGLAKIGSNYNYWIDLAAITAILTTEMIWRFASGEDPRRVRSRFAFGLALVFPIVLVGALSLHLVWFVKRVQPSADVWNIIPAERQRDLRHPADFQWVIQRIQSEPKDVLSESLDVVVLADRPILVEPIIFALMVEDKTWDEGALAQRVCAGDVGLLVLKGPLTGGSQTELGIRSALWPPRVLEALRETMQLEETKASLYLYSWAGASRRSLASASSNDVCR